MADDTRRQRSPEEPLSPLALLEQMPFATLLGITIGEAGPELVRGRLDYAPRLCTAGAIMHGGALMALADTCGAICAFLSLPPRASATGTIESKTNFVRAVRTGSVAAISRPLHIGRTTAVIETDLRCDDETLAAKVIQTQAYRYPSD